MKKVAFYTLGCKTNQYETNKMMDLFKESDAKGVKEEDINQFINSKIDEATECPEVGLQKDASFTTKTRQLKEILEVRHCLFVLGAPGGGKNTQCDLIEEKYQIFHFSCGDLLREAVNEKVPEAEEINKYMKEGKIVPAKITCALQKKCMQKNQGDYEFYLCDGFPRNEENLKGFQEIFGKEIEISGVLYIDCSEEECIKRIKGRNEQLAQKRIEACSGSLSWTLPALIGVQ